MHGHGSGHAAMRACRAWVRGYACRCGDGRGDDHVLSGLRDCLFLHCMLNRLPLSSHYTRSIHPLIIEGARNGEVHVYG